jgi:hypothetical protein
MVSVADPGNSAKVDRILQQAFRNWLTGPASAPRKLPERDTDNSAKLPGPATSVITEDDANRNRALPSLLPAERIERVGTVSGRAVIEASETAAKDIEQAGQSAMEIAVDMMREAQELAKDLRATGKRMNARLQEFTLLSKKVSTAMRSTHAELLTDVMTTRLPETEEESPEPSRDKATDRPKVLEMSVETNATVPS